MLPIVSVAHGQGCPSSSAAHPHLKNRPELDLVRGSDNGRCGERGVAAVLVIAQMTTPIGMPMGSYLSGPRTGAQDSSAQLEGLGAVASRRLQ